jgi:hypothetical protein
MVEALEACNDYIKFTIDPETGPDCRKKSLHDPSRNEEYLNQK